MRRYISLYEVIFGIPPFIIITNAFLTKIYTIVHLQLQWSQNVSNFIVISQLQGIRVVIIFIQNTKIPSPYHYHFNATKLLFHPHNSTGTCTNFYYSSIHTVTPTHIQILFLTHILAHNRGMGNCKGF